MSIQVANMLFETKEALGSDYQSFKKLVRLHTAIGERLDVKYIEEILKQEGDINYRLPTTRAPVPHPTGCTALFFAYSQRDKKIFNALLNAGADFTTKNNKGLTVLHERIICYSEIKGQVQDSFIDSVLSAHIKFCIHENPRSRDGLTHFHAACITNNSKAIRFFIKNGVSVDQAVYWDSLAFPGYTPLHFACRFGGLDAVKVLLHYGANMNIKDAKVGTPLHMLIQHNITIMSMRVEKPLDLEMNEKIIKLILEKDSVRSPSEPDDIGLSKFHVACSLTDVTLAKRLIQHVRDVNKSIHTLAPFASGYTALHLAALFSMSAVQMLCKKGANMMATCVHGMTPLDICLEKYFIEDVYAALVNNRVYKEIVLSDGKTKLLDYLFAIRDPVESAKLLRQMEDINAVVPSDSPLWPNYTLLHIAIILYHRSDYSCKKQRYYCVIQQCLNLGADVTFQHNGGNSLIHFAFRLKEIDLVNMLFPYHNLNVNPINDWGWSHFHIACVAQNYTKIEQFMKNGVDISCPVGSSFRRKDVHIPSGSTPLHIAVAIGSEPLAEILLKKGADLHARDDDGFTAVHRVITTTETFVGQRLIEHPDLKECVIDGLSHLHVACYVKNQLAIKKLIRLGSDINAAIGKSACFRFAGYTPLRMAIHCQNWDIAQMLILGQGADASDLMFHVLRETEHLEHPNPFISLMKHNSEIERHLNETEGITLLHVACKNIDPRLFKKALARGVDVNKQMKGGYTAMHLLMIEAGKFLHDYRVQKFDYILKKLLENGADVSLVDAEMNTPLHIADKFFYIYMDEPYESPCVERVTMMLQSIKDFSVNPVNADGISHFHIACSWNNVEVVKGFLKNGVNVNQFIDHFCEEFGGSTALHLSLRSQTKCLTGWEPQMSICNLLFNSRVDPTAEDSRGNTPLHLAAKYGPPRIMLFNTITYFEVDINAKNIYGETPLELLLQSKDVSTEDIEFFIKRGCRMNDFNPISRKGYIAITFSSPYHVDIQTRVLDAIMKAPNIIDVDDNGCTAIHNIASTSKPIIGKSEYTEIIEKLIKLGCDIDHQDRNGQTALHFAVQFQNKSAILGLLAAGADVNINDKKGKPAFAYTFDPPNELGRITPDSDIIQSTFALYVFKLQIANLYVSPINERLKAKYFGSDITYDFRLRDTVLLELARMKTTNINSTSVTLYDFISETGAVCSYPRMPYSVREAVNDFFDSSRITPFFDIFFNEMASIVRLQYRKALARLWLIESSKERLDFLARIPLPDPCSECICRFLNNLDLTNLINTIP